MSDVIDYTIGVQTGASVVNPALFHQQILDSTMSTSAKTDLEGVSTGGGIMSVSFANTISTGAGSDREKLDALALAHLGEVTSDSTQRAIDFGSDTPNSGTWVNSLSLQSNALGTGSYLLIVKCEIRLTNGANFNSGSPTNYPDRACEARVRIDGADRVRWISPWNTWHAVMAADVLDFVIGSTPLIEIDFRLLGAGDSAQIRRRIINLSVVAGSGGEG